MIAFRGVRSSWLMWARSEVRAASAAAPARGRGRGPYFQRRTARSAAAARARTIQGVTGAGGVSGEEAVPTARVEAPESRPPPRGEGRLHLAPPRRTADLREPRSRVAPRLPHLVVRTVLPHHVDVGVGGDLGGQPLQDRRRLVRLPGHDE